MRSGSQQALSAGVVPPAEPRPRVALDAAECERPTEALPGRSVGRGWVAGVPTRLLAVPYEVALPHGRPAADAGRSGVPAARIQAVAEPVHALAGAVSYGQEPDAVVGLPAPAPQGPDIPHPAQGEAAHTGAATLRLRGFDGAGGPAASHGQLWPPAVADPGSDPDPDPDPGSEPATTEPAASGPASGEAAAGSGPDVPQPEGTRTAGVPGPQVADIVAQAVARGMGNGTDGAQDSAQDVPRIAPARGAAVTEVPVHLPFLGERSGATPPPPHTPAKSSAVPRPPAPRSAPGRRVPRGDDRLREHRGPVLPGWVGVGVGGLALAGCLAVLWRAGAVPAAFVAAFGATPRAYHGLRATHWPPLAFLGIVALLALGGLGRGAAGHAWVLTLFGRYRGTVRRTGLTWVSPLLLRSRVDVRLRHWRSEPMPAVDSGGLALQVVVQVVWQVKDTARATLAVEDHTEYLAEQVESAMARVLSQLPADAFHEDAPTLRDVEAVGDALTLMLATETEAVGIEVYSAQPTRIEYAPEVAEAMRRRRVAAIDAKHRDAVLGSIVDAVDDTVHRLTSRGLVELDDYERKALVKDLTVAFYTGRSE
ncbi:SPFH domain-containing protein [Streptomyces sp. NPDC006430]|uniref:SPFH domain-containing protein n=1 Tax=Streptomyces sp. NPDC006430 TaxID=3154299 RepID=UPI0033A41240